MGQKRDTRDEEEMLLVAAYLGRVIVMWLLVWSSLPQDGHTNYHRNHRIGLIRTAKYLTVRKLSHFALS